ncbi:MAG: hypothetical protein ACON5A_05425 [Candidatus Comchoanobacterales bacterium]
MARCLVIGAGVMGLSQAHRLANDGHRVSILTSPYDQIQQHNESYICPFGSIHSSIIVLETLSDSDYDFIFVATSVAGLNWAVSIIQQCKHPKVILLTKGWLNIDREVVYPYRYLIQNLIQQLPVAQLSGPCLASDLYAGNLVVNNVASTNPELTNLVVEAFSTSSYQIKAVDSIDAVSIFGALKNIYAIYLSICETISLSTASARLVDVIGEMNEIYKQQKFDHFDPLIVHDVCGVGDLVLTSKGGRNGKLGQYLAQYLTIQDAIKPLSGVTLEGYSLGLKIDESNFCTDHFPILHKMIEILTGRTRLNLDSL